MLSSQHLVDLFAVITPSFKLEWYVENVPDKEQWAKDIFIDAVSVLCQSYCTWFISLQLWPYYSALADKRMNVAQPASATIQPLNAQQSTVAGILGLGRIRRRTAQWTLKAEVQTYLNEAPSSSSSMSYWEV
jgi:hypothetical protein